MNVSDQARVRRFADALDLAVYDKGLENQGFTIVHYFDTDAVFATVMGFMCPGRQAAAPVEVRLVRAFLSCGFLRTVHLLRAHALELHDSIRWQCRQFSRSRLESLRDERRAFLEETGTDVILDSLRKIVDSEDVVKENSLEDTVEVDSAEDIATRFVNKLQIQPGETFARLDQVNLPFWSRLSRYRDTGYVEYEFDGPDTPELVFKYGDLFHDVYRTLLRDRGLKPTAVLEDAAALLTLHGRIRDRDEGNGDNVVRFYTETTVLEERIRQDSQLRNLLSYERLPNVMKAATPDARLVLRGAHYYILRTAYKELAIGEAATDPEGYGKLKTLSKRLREILTAKDGDLIADLARLRLRGKRLDDLIDEFEKLEIMQEVWANEASTSDLRDLDVLSQWRGVFEFAATGMEDELVRRVGEVQQQLHARIEREGARRRLFASIRLGADRLSRKAHGLIEDPMRDLGLVRWGYSLTDSEKQEVVRVSGDLLHKHRRRRQRAAIDVLGLIAESRHDVRKCMTTCGILWGIGCFPEAVSLVNECSEHVSIEQLPPALRVFQAAAEARAAHKLNLESRRALVDGVWLIQQGVPEPERLGMLLGVGYVLYHAWESQRRAEHVDPWNVEQLDEEVRGWAERSCELGREAYRRLREGGLARAFATNHCAYVGTVSRVCPGETADFVQRLFKLENNREVWTSRFDDTLGTYYLIEAERRWHRGELGGTAAVDLDHLMSSAAEYLRRAAERDMGDTDVRKHRNRLQMLDRLVAAAQAPGGETVIENGVNGHASGSS